MHAESIDPATQIFERTADAEHASMTDKPTRELHSVKKFTCLHSVLLCTEAVLCCKAKCDEGRFLVRRVQVHKRPKLKQHGRVVHASTLGVYFKSPQLSHSQWKGQNEAFIVLLVGWCAICLDAVKMAPLLRRKMVKHSNIAAAKVPCMHSGSASLATHGFLGSPRAFPRKLIIARTFCELLVYRFAKLLQYKKK